MRTWRLSGKLKCEGTKSGHSIPRLGSPGQSPSSASAPRGFSLPYSPSQAPVWEAGKGTRRRDQWSSIVTRAGARDTPQSPYPSQRRRCPAVASAYAPAATPTAPIQGCAVVVVERTAGPGGPVHRSLPGCQDALSPAPCQCGRGLSWLGITVLERAGVPVKEGRGVWRASCCMCRGLTAKGSVAS